jgi:hypothetical protein
MNLPLIYYTPKHLNYNFYKLTHRGQIEIYLKTMTWIFWKSAKNDDEKTIAKSKFQI